MTFQQGDAGEQHQTADQISHAVERERTNVIHTDALCDESNAPDKSSENKKKRLFQIYFLHNNANTSRFLAPEYH